MRILYLGPVRPNMIDFLRSQGDEVVHTEKKISIRARILSGVDCIVSYGYQFILSQELLSRFPRRVVNLHISLLPWNRGKDPNLWSFLEDTPKGVTIHHIDPGIDTGDLLAQREIQFDDSHTLSTSYDKLSNCIEELFMQVWPGIRDGSRQSSLQPEGGTFHYAKEKRLVEHFLTDGWDTPVKDLIGKAVTVTSPTDVEPQLRDKRMGYVIATSRAWHQGMAQRLSQQTGERFDLITDKKELTLDHLRELNPTYVFFPHWSYLIPSDIYEQFECVIFHMTDVPFGRGGSPLQNLISRGIYETQMTALKCVKELDAGPVYMKRPFSLHGDAEQIYIRSGRLIETMIAEFIKTKPTPQAQTGKAVTFKRRRPEQSTIESVDRLDKLYDHIRMLDAEGYPSAFLKSGRFRLEFGRASMKQGRIVAEVVIKEQTDE